MAVPTDRQSARQPPWPGRVGRPGRGQAAGAAVAGVPGVPWAAAGIRPHRHARQRRGRLPPRGGL